MSATILVILTDLSLREAIAKHLRSEGMRVIGTASLTEGLALLRGARPHLVIYSRGLSDRPMRDVCRDMRREGDPLILLLVRGGDVVDASAALDAGADHCLTLPCSPAALLAHVHALLRRRPATAELHRPVMQIGDLVISLPTRRATLGGEAMHLTPREFDILAALAARVGRVVSRRELLRLVWGDDESVRSQTLDVHVFSLRRKIEKDPTRPSRLLTIRGRGYRLLEQ